VRFKRSTYLLCVSVLTASLLAAGYASDGVSGPQATLRAGEPSAWQISPGRHWTLSASGPRMYSPLVLCETSGRMWAFCATSLGGSPAITCARFDGTSWTPLQEVVSTQKFEVNCIAAALDVSEKPVVVWADFSEKVGEKCIFSTRWNGPTWSPRETLDKMPSRLFPAPNACTDRQGNVHVVYAGNLVPPEDYAIGGLLAEGITTWKCWHLIFDGRAWGKAKPTTTPGRFHIGDPKISSESDGNVYVVAEVETFTQLARDDDYIGIQTWNGKKWTWFERLTPKGIRPSIASAALDSQGSWHVTWWETRGADFYARKEGRVTNPPEHMSGHGVLRSDSFGRVFHCWQQKDTIQARVWNGLQWTPAIAVSDTKYPTEPVLVPRSEDSIIIVWRESTTIRIQEVLIRKGPESPSAPRSTSQDK